MTGWIIALVVVIIFLFIVFFWNNHSCHHYHHEKETGRDSQGTGAEPRCASCNAKKETRISTSTGSCSGPPLPVAHTLRVGEHYRIPVTKDSRGVSKVRLQYKEYCVNGRPVLKLVLFDEFNPEHILGISNPDITWQIGVAQDNELELVASDQTVAAPHLYIRVPYRYQFSFVNEDDGNYNIYDKQGPYAGPNDPLGVVIGERYKFSPIYLTFHQAF